MSSSKKIIAIIGATGAQGGSVVKSILDDPNMAANWAVRGITRDVSSNSAKQLASKGVEVVAANVDDRDSLLKAFQGAYAVYAVTNYWDKMDMDLEIKQGKTLADTALEAKVQHFIWSSLVNVTKVTDGRLKNVFHFDSKALVEDYIRSISLPATFLMPGFYMSNLSGGMMKQSPPDNAWTLAMPAPVPITAPVPLFATKDDAGKFVKAILLHRDETLGKNVLAATEYYTLQEVLDTFKKVYPEAGKTARYYEAPQEVYKGFLTGAGMPDFAAQEMMENMQLLNDGGYYGGESLDWSHSILEDKLTTLEEFFKNDKAFAELN